MRIRDASKINECDRVLMEVRMDNEESRRGGIGEPENASSRKRRFAWDFFANHAGIAMSPSCRLYFRTAEESHNGGGEQHKASSRKCSFASDFLKLLGYDYWAEVTGCAEVDECTDPNYTSASS